MKLITRKAWGARPAKVPVPHLGSTRGVKVHFTGSLVPQSVVKDHDVCSDLVKAIQRFHMVDNGWNDIGYTALVCFHGYVFEGRGLHHLPAANGAGLNAAHYAVCGLVGNKGVITPSNEMLNGIRDAIEWLRSKGDAGNEIKGHRDGYSTDCPGPTLYAWVKAGAPRPGSPPPWPGRLLKLQTPLMHGHDVEQVQHWLNLKQGNDLVVDGAYGRQTEASVRTYQATQGLDDDGVVGRKTWESLAR
jgi:hypothetical protein